MKSGSLFIFFLLFIRLAVNGQAIASLSKETKEKIQQVENNLAGRFQIEGELPGTIKERMAYYKVKGLSIAVIHHYKIEWVKGYGWADEDLKIRVTDHTLFQAASVSKSLNAVGVLKLVQDKKIDLYADINQYLTSWKFPYDSLSKNKKISVANLLSHTGGLNVHGFGGYAHGLPVPTVVQVLNGSKPANSDPVHSIAEPGINSEYSGGGVTISQMIVMDVSKEPYDKFMAENVLKPMGMINSTFTQPPVGIKSQLLATAYREDGKEIPGKYNIYPEQAAAGLWTNPTDLSTYIIETQLAYQGKSAKVLDQQTTRLRLTPYIDKNTGLGCAILDFNGVKYFNHSGSNEGFRSEYYGSFENGNGLVIMLNSDNGKIIQEIVNSIAKAYQFEGLYQSKTIKKVIVDHTTLQSYVGEYAMAANFTLTVSVENGQLSVLPTGHDKALFLPESQNEFYFDQAGIELEFTKNEKGTVDKIIVHQGGGTQIAKRIK